MLKDIIIKYKGIILLTIGSLLIVLSFYLLIYDKIQLTKEKVFSTVNSKIDSQSTLTDNEEEYDAQITVDVNYIDEDSNDGLENEVPNNTIPKEYIGYLEIPKISLKYGFVDKNSYYNNVNRNIQVMDISDFPDVLNGNFILAGHSGIGSITFFQYLYRLSVSDIAKVTYKDKIYTYKITSIYKEKKDGAVNIKRDPNKTTLTLITCTYKDDTSQTIYIAELTEVN